VYNPFKDSTNPIKDTKNPFNDAREKSVPVSALKGAKVNFTFYLILYNSHLR
jgi:hypothetical protein